MTSHASRDKGKSLQDALQTQLTSPRPFFLSSLTLLPLFSVALSQPHWFACCIPHMKLLLPQDLCSCFPFAPSALQLQRGLRLCVTSPGKPSWSLQTRLGSHITCSHGPWIFFFCKSYLFIKFIPRIIMCLISVFPMKRQGP